MKKKVINSRFTIWIPTTTLDKLRGIAREKSSETGRRVGVSGLIAGAATRFARRNGGKKSGS